MHFINIRLPTNISANAVGGPEFMTFISTTNNLTENRNIQWSYPRNRYSLHYTFQSESQVRNMVKFFNTCYGRAYSFRYKDWSDYKIEKQKISPSEIYKGEYQLYKDYSFEKELQSVKKIITKPIARSVKMFSDGKTILPSPSTYHLNETSGIIIFYDKDLQQRGALIDLEFDLHVRFDSDFLPIKMTNNHYSIENLNIVECL